MSQGLEMSIMWPISRMLWTQQAEHGAHVGTEADEARVKLERSIYAMLERVAFTSQGSGFHLFCVRNTSKY